MAGPLAPANTYFQRDDRLGRLVQRLGEQRLVTVHGPAGAGKTRLAQEAIKTRKDTVWCDLSEAEDVRDALHGLLRELGAEGRGIDDALEELKEHAPLLVVFDNVEHLAGAIAPTIAGFARAGPADLRFLITSRHLLRLPEESVLALGRLDADDARAMLEDRVGRITQAQRLETKDAAAIADLLDDNPLAIEMAAGLFSVLSPSEVLARVRSGLSALTTPWSDASANQASLIAAVSWSLDLLDREERDAFRDLFVFRSPFTASAASAVLEKDAVPLLGALVAKSMYTVQNDRDPRRMLCSMIVREVARSLSLAPSTEAIARHTAWFRERAVTLAAMGRKSLAHAAELSIEAEDVRAVLFRALDGSAPNVELACEAALALESVFGFRGPLERHVEDLRACWNLAKRSTPTMIGALVGARLGLHETATGHPDEGRRTLFETIERAELLPRQEAARVIAQVGHAFATSGFWREGVGLLERALEDVESARDICLLSSRLAEAALARGDHARARALLDRAERALNDDRRPRLEALVIATRATHDWLEGSLDRAEEGYARARELAEEAGDYFSSFNYVAGIAGVQHQKGDLKRALDFAVEAAALAERTSHARHHGLILSFLAAVQAELGLDDDARVSFDRARLKLERAAAPDRAPVIEIVRRMIEREEPKEVAPAEIISEWIAVFGSVANAMWKRRGAKVVLPPLRRLVIGPGARWFSVDGGPRHELAKKRVLRPLLAVLVERHQQKRGPVTDRELFDALWPEDRMSAASARNRLHVALHGLRAMGLSTLIRFEDNGWLLAPELEVTRVT
jgi:hypothetical protein